MKSNCKPDPHTKRSKELKSSEPKYSLFTWDEEPKPTKICTKCNKLKEIETEFHTVAAGGYMSQCKQCHAASGKGTAKAKKGRTPPTDPDRTCPGCNKIPEELKTSKPFTWRCDHDHTTGVFRNWICHRCNLALGHAKDDPITLLSLAEYLQPGILKQVAALDTN